MSAFDVQKDGTFYTFTDDEGDEFDVVDPELTDKTRGLIPFAASIDEDGVVELMVMGYGATTVIRMDRDEAQQVAALISEVAQRKSEARS